MIRVIDVHCAKETREQAAARLLGDCIERAWPAAGFDPGFDVTIIPNAKCYGQDVSDIDILVFATFPSRTVFSPVAALPGPDGDLVDIDDIVVRGLALTIEVKDHSPGDVRFIGGRVVVAYGGREVDASEQSHKQRIAVQGHLRSLGTRPPFIRNLIWLRGLMPHHIPPAAINALPATITWSAVLQRAAQVRGPAYRDGTWYIDAFEKADVPGDIAAPFTRELKPTRLDRLRMEQLGEQVVESVVKTRRLEDHLGKRLVLLRGRGGTGKTVLLLQLARRLYEREEARVLLLTYNHALVADIRRLIALLQLTGADGSRALQVQTVHAHLHDVCTALGTNDGHGFPPGDQFDEYYCKMKSEALAYLRAGAVGRSDIEALRAQGAQAIGFDFVFVDEGQDWPGDERDLLYATYGHECLVVADGIEQLTRGPDPADWRGALRKEQVHTVFLGTALRMKANLARFVQKVSEELGVSYPAPNANDAVPGGQVLVVDGDYFGNRALHDELVRQNAAAGNQPVDMLFCVPPSMVRHLADGSSVSVPSERFAKWGLQVWDATDVSTRRGIPLDVAQHRLVQYDSCRGLEGWTVVAFRLDELYDYKQAALAREASGEGIDRLGSARKMAGFWTLIPLTRAMDTLVIHLGPSASVVRTALERVLPECEDFVRWQRC